MDLRRRPDRFLPTIAATADNLKQFLRNDLLLRDRARGNTCMSKKYLKQTL